MITTFTIAFAQRQFRALRGLCIINKHGVEEAEGREEIEKLDLFFGIQWGDFHICTLYGQVPALHGRLCRFNDPVQAFPHHPLLARRRA